MADLPPRKIPVAHSVCEFTRVHERDVFVYSFSPCVYRNFEVMRTCIQIPPQVFTQIVKQFVSLKLAHMWNLHGNWLHTKQCGRASIKVCSQIRRQNKHHKLLHVCVLGVCVARYLVGFRLCHLQVSALM